MPKFVVEVDTKENTMSVTKDGEAFVGDSSEVNIRIDKHTNYEGDYDCGIGIEEYEKKDGIRRMVRSVAEKSDRENLTSVLKNFMK